MSPQFGYCGNCGSRVMTVGGSHGDGMRSRSSQLASAALSDRRVGYVIESIDRDTGRDRHRLICRDCVDAVARGVPA